MILNLVFGFVVLLRYRWRLGERTPVTIDFGTANAQAGPIDDVFVDPNGSGRMLTYLLNFEVGQPPPA